MYTPDPAHKKLESAKYRLEKLIDDLDKIRNEVRAAMESDDRTDKSEYRCCFVEIDKKRELLQAVLEIMKELQIEV